MSLCRGTNCDKVIFPPMFPSPPLNAWPSCISGPHVRARVVTTLTPALHARMPIHPSISTLRSQQLYGIGAQGQNFDGHSTLDSMMKQTCGLEAAFMWDCGATDSRALAPPHVPRHSRVPSFPLALPLCTHIHLIRQNGSLECLYLDCLATVHDQLLCCPPL